MVAGMEAVTRRKKVRSKLTALLVFKSGLE